MSGAWKKKPLEIIQDILTTLKQKEPVHGIGLADILYADDTFLLDRHTTHQPILLGYNPYYN